MGEIIAPKYVELIEIINKPLLLHLGGCLFYRVLSFTDVIKSRHLTTSLNDILKKDEIPIEFVIILRFDCDAL